jgi:hypothetical protein
VLTYPLRRRANLAFSFKRKQQQQQQQQGTEAVQDVAATGSTSIAAETTTGSTVVAAEAAVCEPAAAVTATALVAMPESSTVLHALPIHSAAIEDDAVSAFTAADYGESLVKLYNHTYIYVCTETWTRSLCTGVYTL